jgi:hypothetical protein
VSALHITNGDSAAGTLRQFISDPVGIMADPLFEGPAPLVEGDAWHDIRAKHLAAGGDVVATREWLRRSDRLATSTDHDETVLWFEHDLFDQLALVRTLDLIARTAGAPRVSLICIDRFPGIEPFYGLGQLDAAQLSTLFPTRRAVTADAFALASRTWAAFRAPDPRALVAIAAADAPALPFLSDALRRFLAEYPSTRNGLSRTADTLLQSLDRGPLDGHALFRASQAQERHLFIGDPGVFEIMSALARRREPLIDIDGVDVRTASVTLTAAGRDVIAGSRDAVMMNGIDEWRGGVHLLGTDMSQWRWDAVHETLVSCS